MRLKTLGTQSKPGWLAKGSNTSELILGSRVAPALPQGSDIASLGGSGVKKKRGSEVRLTSLSLYNEGRTTYLLYKNTIAL